MKRNWKARGTRQAVSPPTKLQCSARIRSIERVEKEYLREPIRDPIRQREPRNIHNHLNNNKFTTPTRLRCLTLPNRRRRSVDTITYTSDHSADEHLALAVRGDLQDGADTEDRGAEQHAVLAAERIADEAY